MMIVLLSLKTVGLSIFRGKKGKKIMKKCKTIAVVNQKGGVGKTTTTFNLGYELAELGKNVLLIDLDSQGNLTMYAERNPDKLEKTISNLMLNSIKNIESDPKEYIIEINKKLHLIPANIDLSGVELSLGSAMSREYVLDVILEPIKKEYDYILIDCMPSLMMLPINAMATADSVLIPVNPEFWSTKGLETLIKNIMLLRQRINPKIKFEGVLITMNNSNLNLTKEITGIMTSVFKGIVKIFDHKISKSIFYAESSLLGIAASQHNNKHKAAGEYKAFTKELIEAE